METKHTPTPWKVTKPMQGIDGLFYQALNTNYKAGVGEEAIFDFVLTTPNNSNQAANAAFIVRACNAHDELVGALRRAINAQLDCTVSHADGTTQDLTPEWITEALAALKLAEVV